MIKVSGALTRAPSGYPFMRAHTIAEMVFASGPVRPTRLSCDDLGASGNTRLANINTWPFHKFLRFLCGLSAQHTTGPRD